MWGYETFSSVWSTDDADNIFECPAPSENLTFTYLYGFDVLNPQDVKPSETVINYVNDVSGQLTQVLSSIQKYP